MVGVGSQRFRALPFIEASGPRPAPASWRPAALPGAALHRGKRLQICGSMGTAHPQRSPCRQPSSRRVRLRVHEDLELPARSALGCCPSSRLELADLPAAHLSDPQRFRALPFIEARGTGPNSPPARICAFVSDAPSAPQRSRAFPFIEAWALKTGKLQHDPPQRSRALPFIEACDEPSCPPVPSPPAALPFIEARVSRGRRARW